MSFQISDLTVDQATNNSIVVITSNNSYGTGGITGPTGPAGLGDIRSSIIPATGYTIGSGTTTTENTPYFPNTSIYPIKLGGYDLGSPDNPFANLWVGDINSSSQTIAIGGVPISSDPITKAIVLPSGSTIGGGNTPGSLVITAESSTTLGGILDIYCDVFNVFTTDNIISPIFNIKSTGNTTILTPFFQQTEGHFQL